MRLGRPPEKCLRMNEWRNIGKRSEQLQEITWAGGKQGVTGKSNSPKMHDKERVCPPLFSSALLSPKVLCNGSLTLSSNIFASFVPNHHPGVQLSPQSLHSPSSGHPCPLAYQPLGQMPTELSPRLPPWPGTCPGWRWLCPSPDHGPAFLTDLTLV